MSFRLSIEFFNEENESIAGTLVKVNVCTVCRGAPRGMSKRWLTKVIVAGARGPGKAMRACVRSPAITCRLAASEIDEPLPVERWVTAGDKPDEGGERECFDSVSEVRSGEAPTRRVEHSTLCESRHYDNQGPGDHFFKVWRIKWRVGRSESFSSDCLPKTQLSANRQREV